MDANNEVQQLKAAIDRDDLATVQEMMTCNPALHRAPLGYGKDGPLTWVAECRVPRRAPTPDRLAMAEWMIANGSDIHQGGDGPLGRAALDPERIPMMDLLVRHGADVNADWHGAFPILFSPCECVDPVCLDWLLQHGADPNRLGTDKQCTALDYVIGSYVRSPELAECIHLLAAAGGRTRYDLPGVLAVLRGQTGDLANALDADSSLAERRFPELDCGSTGARRLLLKGGTLLHVAAEFGNLDAARLLLDRRVSPNVRADVDEQGIGGQTPIFHSATQFDDAGLEMTRLLLDSGADLNLRAKLPGHYERLDEFVECSPLDYAQKFPGDELPSPDTIALLRSRAKAN